VEGEIPRAFNPNKSPKSRGLDLGYPSDSVSKSSFIGQPGRTTLATQVIMWYEEKGRAVMTLPIELVPVPKSIS
jgi:hypothetical protein